MSHFLLSMDDNNNTMDLDNAMDISPVQTPKIPPYRPPMNSSPRTKLRKEIEELKHSIFEKERQLNVKQARVESLDKECKESNNAADVNRLLSIQTNQHIYQVTERIILQEQRLAMLEENLAKAEEEAEKRVQGKYGVFFNYPKSNVEVSVSLRDVMQSKLSTEGPDDAYVRDDHKCVLMRQMLEAEHALLLRSPPGSGKTSFAVEFTRYLRSNGFIANYVNAATSKNLVSTSRSMDTVWRAIFDGLTFSEVCERSLKEEGTIYVIIDEAQAWYPANVPIEATKQVAGFWADVKYYVKPALVLADYVNDSLSNGGTSKSMATSATTARVRLLCLAGYGETNVGSIATPLAFVDPEDPEKENAQYPLGLNFLRLTRDTTDALITKFISIKGSEGKKSSFDADMRKLIFEETNGHVGAIRTVLFHLINANNKTKDDMLNFFCHSIYQSDLSAYRAFLSVSENSIRQLPPNDMALLVQSSLQTRKNRVF